MKNEKGNKKEFVMKKLRTISIALISMFLLALAVGCEKQGPLTPEQNSVEQKSQPGIEVVKFGNATGSLQKTTTVSKFIKKKKGGTISLYHANWEIGLEANVILKIPKNALSDDATIELTLNDDEFLGSLDVEFHPHGITFNEPAILDIWAQGVDLSNLPLDSLDIYYDNQTAGAWELMPRTEFVAYGNQVEVVGARIPHFSRYAIAISR